jgi:hypothetical protein
LLPRRSPRLCRGSYRLGVFASLYGSNVIVSQLPPGRKLPSSLLLGATRGVRRCVPSDSTNLLCKSMASRAIFL